MKTQMKATSGSSFTPAHTGLLQRKCVFGNHMLAAGRCAEFNKKNQFGLQPMFPT